MVSRTVVPIRHDQFVSRSLPPLKVRESNSEYLWVYLWVMLFQGAWKGVERCGKVWVLVFDRSIEHFVARGFGFVFLS